MSLHGYTGSSGQVGYIQPSPSYQYPQPSHASLHDPNGFRQFYTAQLTALTFNSRHIIQNLSMIAQESTRMSDIVVQCVESHIRRVSLLVLSRHPYHHCMCRFETIMKMIRNNGLINISCLFRNLVVFAPRKEESQTLHAAVVALPPSYNLYFFLVLLFSPLVVLLLVQKRLC